MEETKAPDHMCYCTVPIYKIRKDKHGYYGVCELCGGLVVN